MKRITFLLLSVFMLIGGTCVAKTTIINRVLQAGGGGGPAGSTSYTTGDDSNATPSTNVIGQSFQVPSSGTLETIDIYIGFAGTTGNVTMRVSDSADLNTGYMEEVTVEITDTDDNSWITYTFLDDDNLATSTTYYFGIITDGTANIRWRYDASGSTYSEGNRYSNAGGANNWDLYTEVTDSDYLFRVNN